MSEYERSGYGSGYVEGALRNYFGQGVVNVPGFLPKAAYVGCCRNKRPKFHAPQSEKEFEAVPMEIALADLDHVKEAENDVQMPGTAAIPFRTTFCGAKRGWRWSVAGVVAGTASIEGTAMDGGGSCAIQIRGTTNIVNNSNKTIPDRCLVLAHEPPANAEVRDHAILGVSNRKLLAVLHPFVNGDMAAIFSQIGVKARLLFQVAGPHNAAEARRLSDEIAAFVVAQNMRLREEHHSFDPIEVAARLMAVEHVRRAADTKGDRDAIDLYVGSLVSDAALSGLAHDSLPGATAQIESMVHPGERNTLDSDKYRAAFDPKLMTFSELQHWMRDLASAIKEQRVIGVALGTAHPGQTLHVMLLPRAAT